MSKFNKDKKSCKDVFNAFMLSNANYSGYIEIPTLDKTNFIPNDLISFSKIKNNNDYNKWVHFYEHDYVIERIWKQPLKYLDVLKKYNGVITPDYSLYRDMPLIMQLNNIFKSRTVGRWLQDNGINVIVNIRYGDSRTYKYVCLGLQKHCSISIGTYGAMKDKDDREFIEEGLPYILKTLQPTTLIIYGSISNKIKNYCLQYNVNIVVFPSEFENTHTIPKEV